MDLLSDPTVRWNRFDEGDTYGFPIDYAGALLAVRGNIIDMAYRWEPNHFCHFHRHIAPMTSVILDGELTVTEFDADGNQTSTRIRPTGDYSSSDGVDVHMEQGGPDGAVALFSFDAASGTLMEVLNRDLDVVERVTAEELRAAWDRRQVRQST